MAFAARVAGYLLPVVSGGGRGDAGGCGAVAVGGVAAVHARVRPEAAGAEGAGPVRARPRRAGARREGLREELRDADRPGDHPRREESCPGVRGDGHGERDGVRRVPAGASRPGTLRRKGAAGDPRRGEGAAESRGAGLCGTCLGTTWPVAQAGERGQLPWGGPETDDPGAPAARLQPPHAGGGQGGVASGEEGTVAAE